MGATLPAILGFPIKKSLIGGGSAGEGSVKVGERLARPCSRPGQLRRVIVSEVKIQSQINQFGQLGGNGFLARLGSPAMEF